MAAAQTGTGKTAGFALPLLQRLVQHGPAVSSNRARVLVLVPTRELAEHRAFPITNSTAGRSSASATRGPN
nr:DEAD/DEAH box helicase [Burkholderia sola]